MTSKRDLARYRKLQEIGCICCCILGIPGVPGDIHHIVDKGYRRLSGGNSSTLCLCPYHHRHASAAGADSRYGPSLAHGSKLFAARWGSQRELLARVNDMLSAKA